MKKRNSILNNLDHSIVIRKKNEDCQTLDIPHLNKSNDPNVTSIKLMPH
jgi:hypothetical protein